MRRIAAAAIVALFLGSIVTELESRLFADRYFALLILATLAVFVGALAVLRIDASRTRSVPSRDDAVDAPTAAVPPDDELEGGVVKWFNRTKGFGFIIRDTGGEIFVHHRNIHGSGRRSLKDGERVRFKVTEHDKGLQAEHVLVTRDS